MEPSDEQLGQAIEAALAGREELEQEVGKLVGMLRDDHFMWKINGARVKAMVEARIAAREPPRQVPEELFVLDLATATAASIDAGRDWDSVEVEGVHHAQGGLGSTGCFLVKLAGEGFIVLKQRSQGCENDVFARELFAAAGVSCPKMRGLEADELEVLVGKLRNAKVSVKGTCDEIHGSRFKGAGAMLLEFARGRDLESGALDLGAFSASTCSFEAVGAMLVLDAVINNPDRIPSIWRSDEGNKGNILVNMEAQGGPCFTAIDQTVNPILDADHAAEYMERLADLFSPAVSERVRAFFDLDANEPQHAAMLNGVLRGAAATTAFLKRDPEGLVAKVAKETARAMPGAATEQARAFVLRTIGALPEPPAAASGGEASSFAEILQSLCPLL